VILLEINAPGVAVSKLECDAPRPIDVDRIARRLEASQGMKIKAGNVHFSRPDDDIQVIEATQDAFMLLTLIFPVRPRSQSSARPLLLKLLITDLM
jgi:hypothetical protein